VHKNLGENAMDTRHRTPAILAGLARPVERRRRLEMQLAEQ